MTGLTTCEEHSAAIVVHRAEDTCPFCRAEERMEELSEAVDVLKDETNELRSETADLKKELASYTG